MHTRKISFMERTDMRFDTEAWLKLMCELLYECDEMICEETEDAAA